MHDIHRVKVSVGDRNHVAGAGHMPAQHRVVGPRQPGEIRPNHVVKEVFLNRSQRLLPCVYGEGRLEIFVEYVVDKHR